MSTFDSFGLAPSILRGVRDAGYTTPTPVQAAALPPALKGIDVVGVAQTGTGKTAAFVLPILDYLEKEPTEGKKRVIRALVVTPTRELALQIENSVRSYGAHTRLKSATIYGGVSKGKQRTSLRNGIDIVVATPGRLLDFLGEGVLDLSWVDILVLDEADRMLDMGFVRDVRKIVAAVPEKRQTLLFSATMPSEIQTLAKTVLYKPETIEVGQRRDPAATVAQQAVRVAEKDKQHLLNHLLENEPIEKAIVFTRTKHRADRVRKKLDQAGFDAIAIHSNRSQGQRQRALKGFEEGEYRVLVATDIAARGIDIDGVSHVVNFDAPNIPEDYIHRIGRTGRAESTGDAITFISAAETDHLRSIEKHTGSPLERATYGSFAKGAEAEAPPEPKKKGSDGGGNRGRGQTPRGGAKRHGRGKGQGSRRR